MPKRIITTDKAPAAGGCYSQGTLAGGTLYISGQLPIVPGTREKLATATLQAQTHQVLSNIQGVVEGAGGTLLDIVKVTIYIDDMANWGPVNEVYETFFSNEPPARCVLEVSTLHYGFKIEADAIAYLGE